MSRGGGGGGGDDPLLRIIEGGGGSGVIEADNNFRTILYFSKDYEEHVSCI